MIKYQEKMITDLKTLIEIPSVYEDSPNFMFGENIDKCLDATLEMMKNLGFKTFKATDGAYGYAEVGEGELFAVLGHLDVVPAREEDGWNTPPFTFTEKDGVMYGRGTQDDKGCIITAVYALKSLLDEGFVPKKRIRFIFGLDEETLWRSIAEYTKREETPAMGFTPDSSFPLTYAEKGLLQILIKSDEPSSCIFNGGQNFNSVPAFAECEYNSSLEQSLKDLGFEYKIDNNKLTVVGTTAHAQHPWKGTSAIIRLCEALSSTGINDNVINFICETLNNKPRFEGFSDKDLSDFSGPLSINLGIIQRDETSSVLSLDLRLPATCTKENAMEMIIKKANEYNLVVEEYDWLKSIYVPLESEFIQNLLDAYREVTGDIVSEPKISGGATYARAFDNCVAFGPVFPKTKETEHQPNECMTISDMLKASEVYRVAFTKCVF